MVSNRPLSYDKEQIYSEETLMQMIDAGYVLIINRRWIHKNLDGSYYQKKSDPGHMYVLTGYVSIAGKIWFVLLDPGPGVDEGTAQLMTYEKLCCGYVDSNAERSDHGFWWGSVLVDPEFDYETRPWLGPENFEVKP